MIASAGIGNGGITIGASSEPRVVVSEGFNFAIVRTISPDEIVMGPASGFVAKKPAAMSSYGG
jgi:hypothetical protein